MRTRAWCFGWGKFTFSPFSHVMPNQYLPTSTSLSAHCRKYPTPLMWLETCVVRFGDGGSHELARVGAKRKSSNVYYK